MRKILKYIWSSLFLFFACSSQISASDSISIKTKTVRGVYLDADIIEPLFSISDNKHKGLNTSLSVNLNNSIIPTITAGYASYDATDDYACYKEQSQDYLYKVYGPYFKLGVNFNFIKSKEDYKPICYLGARYSFSCFQYDLFNVRVQQNGWEERLIINDSENSFVQWGEFLGGVKVPVYKRFNMGFEGFYKWGFHQSTETTTSSEGFKTRINHSYAPGFGDLNGVKWGFRYLIGIEL